MASESQIAANRANSTKSTGPKTAAGRAKSSQNSLKHSLLARTIVLEDESADRFRLLLSNLQDEFQPSNSVEASLVENMAVARWRQMRLWGMEKAGLAAEIRRREAAQTNSGPTASSDGPTQAALAFRTLCDESRSLDLMHRYEARCDRQYDRALDRLLQLREKKCFFPNEANF